MLTTEKLSPSYTKRPLEVAPTERPSKVAHLGEEALSILAATTTGKPFGRKTFQAPLEIPSDEDVVLSAFRKVFPTPSKDEKDIEEEFREEIKFGRVERCVELFLKKEDQKAMQFVMTLNASSRLLICQQLIVKGLSQKAWEIVDQMKDPFKEALECFFNDL